MSDKEWADAVLPDLLKMAPQSKPGPLRRLLLRNIHLGRRGSYDAAARSVGAVCA